MNPIKILKVSTGYNLIKEIIYYLTKPLTWLKAFWGLIIMETFFRLAPRFRLSRINFFMMNGTFFLKPGPLASAFGGIIFYSGAVFWVALYKLIKEKTKFFCTFRPFKFGTSLFLLTSFLIMPLSGLINPQMKRGLLKKPGMLGLNLDGWKTPVSNLLAHLLFAYVIDSLEIARRKKLD